MNSTVVRLTLGILIHLSAVRCDKNPASSEEPYVVEIAPAEFVPAVDNQYFPLTPGMTYIYGGETEDGLERIEVAVTRDTREVMGVTCTVVHDRVWLNGELIEDTFDWYAQHQDGSVWYFGEDSKEIENGVVVSMEGSWEAGVDGALPGIVMHANPQANGPYRQEFYKGEAEDMAEVLSLTESVSVVYGAFQNCLKTREWTPLDSEVVEEKYYAPGIGHVLEVMVKGGSDRIELEQIITE